MTSLATLVRTVVVATVIAASQAASAQCSGFTDVDPANALCPSVDWLRNRAVTLGCTSATLFCPADSVIRLSMAAFINRLGNALTASVVTAKDNGAGLPLPGPTTICQATLPGTAYPRSASVIGVVTAQVGSPTSVSMRVVTALVPGSWNFATQAPPPLAGGSGWITGSVQKSAIPLAANLAHFFAVQLDPTPGTTSLGPWTCEIKVKVVSQTGTGFPY